MDFLSSDGIVSSFQGIEYYVPAKEYKWDDIGDVDTSRTFKAPAKPASPILTPAAVFHFGDGESISIESLERHIKCYHATDDVFNISFLTHILVLAPKATVEAGDCCDLTTLAKDLTDRLRAPEICHDSGIQVKEITVTSKMDAPKGPYFLINRALYQAWRCYDDPAGAFTTSIAPSPSESYSFVVPPTNKICVPSRLYFERPTDDKPLLGLRVAVKDVIDIKGIKTGNCCRAYEQLYPSREKNASCIQRLLKLGAVLVGKTKTVQFASGAHPMDWVDTQCSFNCRGDGYQDPGISSTGSAAALAAYEWLDFAIGTDTIGSTITPASVCGLFGLRPTVDTLDMDGIIPVTKHLDTVGVFTRTAPLLSQITSSLFQLPGDIMAWKTGNQAALCVPPDLWPISNAAYQAEIENFVQDFEDFVNCSRRTDASLAEIWHGLSGAPDIPLTEYLRTTAAHIQLFDCYNNSESFRSEFKTKRGHDPFVDPPITYKWDLGKKISKANYEKALQERDLFRSLFVDHILPRGSVSFLLVPAEGDEPNYRDQYFGSGEESGKSLQGFGFKVHCLPALLGCPAYCIPIGEYSYTSRITGIEEKLPICANLIGPPGSEAWAPHFLNELLTFSGRARSVLTSKHAFTPGYKPGVLPK